MDSDEESGASNVSNPSSPAFCPKDSSKADKSDSDSGQSDDDDGLRGPLTRTWGASNQDLGGL